MFPGGFPAGAPVPTRTGWDQGSLRALFDQIALRRIDAHTALAEVGEAAVELVRLARQLEEHPAFLAVDVSAPDVRDDLEAVPELVDHGLRHQVAREAEPYPAAGYRATPPATAGTIEISSFSPTFDSSPSPSLTSWSLR